MLHNSGVFLRRAAEEIVEHDDVSDEPFDVDRATLVIVLIQTAVELATTAIVIKHDGLAGAMAKHLPQSEAEAETRWQTGDLQTSQFRDVKARATDMFGDEDFWSLVNEFQILRNKLVHFHRPLDSCSLFDLKYEAMHVLIQMISTLAETDEYDLPDGSLSFLGQELFDRFLSFEPYRYRISCIAKGLSYCRVWCLKVPGHAAIWFWFVASIPSLKVTPLMTLAR
jgi:hypothetical protein